MPPFTVIISIDSGFFVGNLFSAQMLLETGGARGKCIVGRVEIPSKGSDLVTSWKIPGIAQSGRQMCGTKSRASCAQCRAWGPRHTRPLPLGRDAGRRLPGWGAMTCLQDISGAYPGGEPDGWGEKTGVEGSFRSLTSLLVRGRTLVLAVSPETFSCRGFFRSSREE